MASNIVPQSIFANVLDGKAIVISGVREQSYLVFHGSTMQASVAPNAPGDHLRTITFYPKQGEEGIIALVIHAFTHHGGGKYNHAQFNEIPVFLKLTWKDDGGGTKKPFVDLANPWYPADRIGQIRKEHIEVSIRGNRFASYDHAQWNFNEKKNCPMFVPDGNLLCHYLWGTAHAADVLHAVVQEKIEPTREKRIELLTNQLRRAQSANDVLRPMAESSGRFQELYREALGSVRILELTAHAGATVCDLYLYAQDVIRAVDELYDRLNKLPAVFRRLPWISRFIRVMNEYKEKTKPNPVSA